MKKILLAFTLMFICGLTSWAQYVPISVTVGASIQNVYPNCVTYDPITLSYQMDTTCLEILQEDSLKITVYNYGDFGLKDLTYFKGVQYLFFQGFWPDRDTLPAGLFLPPNLKKLYTIWCGFGGQINYPPTLDTMHIIGGEKYCNFQDLPDNLSHLDLDATNGDSIKHAPLNLEYFRQWQIDMGSNLQKPIDMRHCTKLKKVVFDMLYDGLPKGALELLPDNLEEIVIKNGYYDTINYLPSGLRKMDVTVIKYIAYFPPNLISLQINGYVPCFPEYPQTLQFLNVNADGLGPNFCHPNFVPGLGIGNDLCSIPGNNFANCPATSNALSGHVFHDLNNDCSYDLLADLNLFGIPVVIEDGAGLYIKTYTDENGFYSVNVPDGNYTVKIDTSETLMRKTCSNFDYSYNVLFDQNNNYQQQHFQLTCDTLIYNQVDSFDIQLTNVFGSLFRPGNEQAMVCISASDVIYNKQLTCSSGFANSLDTLVRFDFKVYGAPMNLSPLNGSNITQSKLNDTLYFNYVDSNFRLDLYSHVCVYVEVDSTAQIGDWVCMDAVMTPPPGDVNASNNSLSQCFEVVNSYDPNMKQTWPMEVLPGYDGEFRYTIHFLNTGNAPAIHVQLVDTLDSQLDLSTFQVIEASHQVQPYLSGNRLLFKFNNINLADSVSDPEGSKGHVSYRIKLKNAMQLGDQVKNTAHIFFDFNTAIVTNTTTNTCVTSINELGELVAEGETFVLYPNPVQHENSIRITQLPTSNTVVRLIGLDGKVYTEQTLSAQNNTLSLPQLKAGVYLVQIALPNGMQTRKLVKL